MNSLLRSLLGAIRTRRALPATRNRPGRRFRPSLETLEARTVPAILSDVLFPPPAPEVVAPAPGSPITGTPPPGDAVVTPSEEILVIHHTSSNANPFVLLGIPNDNPAVENHLFHGTHDDHDHTDIIVDEIVRDANGLIIEARIRFLTTSTWDETQPWVVAGLAAMEVELPDPLVNGEVVTVTGATALGRLIDPNTGQQLEFTQGSTGNADGVQLAVNLGLSLDVNPGNSEGGPLGAHPVAPANTDQAGDFIRDLYQALLDRTASASEVDGWRGVLQTAGAQAVVNAIDQSFEAQHLRVLDWYGRFLDRTPQGEELGWVALLQSGASEEQVLSIFLSSPEVFAHANAQFGTQNDAGSYIRHLYDTLLGRDPSASELAGWSQVMATQPLQAVALGFLTSAEFRARTVESLYADLLGRNAADAEVAGWVSSGLSLEQIRQAIAGSAEFFNR